jgi:hypothetical protein
MWSLDAYTEMGVENGVDRSRRGVYVGGIGGAAGVLDVDIEGSLCFDRFITFPFIF